MLSTVVQTFPLFREDLHSTYDVDRLSFDSEANILHADNWTQQVHTEPHFLEVPLAAQFHMGGHEVLRKITAQWNDFLTEQEIKSSQLLQINN